MTQRLNIGDPTPLYDQERYEALTAEKKHILAEQERLGIELRAVTDKLAKMFVQHHDVARAGYPTYDIMEAEARNPTP